MSIRTLSLLLLGLLSFSAHARQDWSRFTHPPAAVEVIIPAPESGATLIPLDTPRGHLTLALHPHTLRAPDARGWIDAGAAEPQEFELPPAATFAGTVVEWPGSIVAAAVVANGLRVVIDPAAANEELCYLQPAADFGGLSGHVFYTASNVLPGPWVCGGALEAPASGGTPYSPRVCSTVAQIAFDADYAMYAGNGFSVAATVADIESIMIAVDLIYGRDVGIEHQSTGYVVRTTNPDGYTTTSPGGLLDQFRIRWGTSHAGIPRDMAHLMTGRELDGNVIGVAWVNVICNSGFGYGLSQALFTTDLAYRAALVAHEMGHNWSAGHCDGDADCSIMCSGIGGCANNVSLLSARSVTEITNARNAASCLSTGMAVTHADGVVLLPGQSARVDVMGNDSGAACGDFLLLSFNTTTPLGGTISRSVGTGPAGRDELIVQAGAVAGETQFNYVIRNVSGQFSTGTVYVTIIPPRPAETAPLTAPGLLAEYFLTLPNSVTELPLGTPDGTTTAATVDFPSSDQPIAGGTRQAGVGLIITGSITVPAAANYTFYLESDDGSALYINNQLILINDGPQGMTEIGGTMTLNAGTYPVRIEYVQGGGNAGLIARVSSTSVPKQVIPASWWGPAGVTINRVALGGTFNDLPAPGALPIARRGVVLEVNQPDNSQPLLSSTRTVNIAASMNGHFNAPQTALYRFFLNSDDASELRIGEQVVVSNRGAHGMIERSGVIALEAGLHQLSIDYWQGGGGAGIIASVASPTLLKQPIPASMLVHAVADCDGDGQDDARAVVEALDLGDVAVGGNGRGSGTPGAGIVPITGRLVAPNVSGGSRASGNAVFQPLNGLGGRANIPMVEGVLVPNASTTCIVGQPPFLFSPTGGGAFDAIRNGFGYFDGTTLAPIVLADQPGVARPGLGMHANSGLTFDLVQVRAANPGRSVLGVRGVAGLLRDGCAGRDAAAELYVLIDGQVAYRSVLTDDALAQVFDVNISSSAQFLTLAMLDARTNNCDHFAIADAQLLLSTAQDEDLDGIPDFCQCPADFNRDGGVDGGDVEAFFVAWESSAPEADTNRDGGVDGSDVEAFFVAWEAGGC
jgi:hypothetical protein